MEVVLLHKFVLELLAQNFKDKKKYIRERFTGIRGRKGNRIL